MQDLQSYLEGLGRKAQQAARMLSQVSTQQKNQALEAMAQALEENQGEILHANALDMESGRERGLNRALLDRLMLNAARIQDMAQGLRALVVLPDPVGQTIQMWTLPNGAEVGKKRVPLGVIGIVYEARPNVTVDAAGLCLKTGNAVILRGGSEAFQTNLALAKLIQLGVAQAGLPAESIQLVESQERTSVDLLLKLNQYLDVLIPRGGTALIRKVVETATVPVIETGVGNCHTYLEADADPKMAEAIVINAKVQRPGVCNAMETLLVHRDLAPSFLPAVGPKLQQLGVELRACPKSLPYLPQAQEATAEDWDTEYLDLILAVKTVDSLEEALEHIHTYGTKHSEAIITNDYQKSRQFLQAVDAAAVYVNASTRLTDGGQFGFGAEIGISTQKLHARGPMGLSELTTIKYIIYGDGQIRE